MAITAPKIRRFLADFPTVDVVLPLKASTSVPLGAFCELSGGAVDNFSGAGEFCGIALESKTGLGTDGAETIKMRIQGAVEVGIADSIAITSVANANTVEATDNDTLRLETGAAITGGTVGRIARVMTAGASGANKVVLAFKAGALLP